MTLLHALLPSGKLRIILYNSAQVKHHLFCISLCDPTFK